jgi:hypothetical protein
MTTKRDTAQALTFLKWLRPSGPWTLTAIPVEQGRTFTETFHDLRAAQGWIEERNGKLNIYFAVNPLRSSFDKKAKKADVEELAFLHVDVDPRKGQDLKSEQRRALKVLEDFSPSPSAIIFSGGGYQGFWRLDEPLYVGGSAETIANAEAYNRQLEIVLGGDHCWNIDRIMRLPGTVNIPDEKKRKRGREAALAQIIQLNDLTYPLHEFTAAPEVQSTKGNSPNKVQISGNIRRLTDLDADLPEAVTPRTRMLIVQGDDPDNPTRYSSKSEVMWAVTCELIRAGCEDDTIAAVLLDPDFGVSDHPLRQKRSVEYVARQIERAREEVIEPMLRKLNEEHAVIADLGGKCRVVSEVLDQNLGRPRLSKQSFEDFRNRYMHIKVQVGEDKEGNPKYDRAGKWWLEHPMRRQYKTLVFAPERDVADAYNLWRGFACEAIPGAGHQPFLDHLRDNVCSGNEEHYQYLLRWMARAVQKPGEQGHVAVVLRGGRGAGKGTVAQIFGSLFGRHFLHISSAKHLVGQFNAHLRDCVFLFADEAFYAGDKQHESVLKTLVTEDTIIVEGKGVDAEPSPNFVHLLMASNDQWVVPAGEDERRFFVLNVSEERKQDKAYFKALHRQMEEGGREALLHYLMTLDLSDFEVRNVPSTEALREQKEHNLSAEQEWLLPIIEEAALPGYWPEATDDELQRVRRSNGAGPEAPGLYDLMRQSSPRLRHKSDAALGRFLKQWGFENHKEQRGRVGWRGWRFPALLDLRALWTKKFGGWRFDGPTEWDHEPLGSGAQPDLLD